MSRKGKLPKRIGGVKVPKDLRRAAEGLIDQGRAFVEGPAGRQMLAAGLTMAAAALRQAPAPKVKPAATPGETATPPGARRPEELGAAVATAATAALGRWLASARAEMDDAVKR